MQVKALLIGLPCLLSGCFEDCSHFTSSRQLSSAERGSLVAFHPSFRDWAPTDSAIITEAGEKYRVAVMAAGISLGLGYMREVLVFTEAGELAGGDLVGASTFASLTCINSVHPLKLRFLGSDAPRDEIATGVCDLNGVRRVLSKHLCDCHLSEMNACLLASGLTNRDLWFTIMQNASEEYREREK